MTTSPNRTEVSGGKMRAHGMDVFHLKRTGAITRIENKKFIPLRKTVTTIGRNAMQVDFVINSANTEYNSTISRKHARVIKKSQGFRIYDDSRNGVFINDIKISGDVILEVGDTITFGHPTGELIKAGTRVRQPDSEFQFIFEQCDGDGHCCGDKANPQEANVSAQPKLSPVKTSPSNKEKKSNATSSKSTPLPSKSNTSLSAQQEISPVEVSPSNGEKNSNATSSKSTPLPSKSNTAHPKLSPLKVSPSNEEKHVKTITSSKSPQLMSKPNTPQANGAPTTGSSNSDCVKNSTSSISSVLELPGDLDERKNESAIQSSDLDASSKAVPNKKSESSSDFHVPSSEGEIVVSDLISCSTNQLGSSGDAAIVCEQKSRVDETVELATDIGEPMGVESKDKPRVDDSVLCSTNEGRDAGKSEVAETSEIDKPVAIESKDEPMVEDSVLCSTNEERDVEKSQVSEASEIDKLVEVEFKDKPTADDSVPSLTDQLECAGNSGMVSKSEYTEADALTMGIKNSIEIEQEDKSITGNGGIIGNDSVSFTNNELCGAGDAGIVPEQTCKAAECYTDINKPVEVAHKNEPITDNGEIMENDSVSFTTNELRGAGDAGIVPEHESKVTEDINKPKEVEHKDKPSKSPSGNENTTLKLGGQVYNVQLEDQDTEPNRPIQAESNAEIRNPVESKMETNQVGEAGTNATSTPKLTEDLPVNEESAEEREANSGDDCEVISDDYCDSSMEESEEEEESFTQELDLSDGWENDNLGDEEESMEDSSDEEKLSDRSEEFNPESDTDKLSESEKSDPENDAETSAHQESNDPSSTLPPNVIEITPIESTDAMPAKSQETNNQLSTGAKRSSEEISPSPKRSRIEGRVGSQLSCQFDDSDNEFQVEMPAGMDLFMKEGNEKSFDPPASESEPRLNNSAGPEDREGNEEILDSSVTNSEHGTPTRSSGGSVSILLAKLKAKKVIKKEKEETDSAEPSTSNEVTPKSKDIKPQADLIKRASGVLDSLLQVLTSHGDIIRSSGRIQSWLKAHQEVREKAKLPKTVIAVVGDTGAGKSSLMNALLDHADILPTSGMQACTAVVTQVDINSQNDFYEADIEFLSKKDWNDELRILLGELTGGDGRVKNRQPDPKSEAGVAFSKVRSVYGNFKEGVTYEELVRPNMITQWLGRTRKIQEKRPKEFRKLIDYYIESTETGSGGQYWPIVKHVSIRIPRCHVCSTGATLVDLPGIRDANAARDKIAKDYLRNCTAVFVVASIHRAIDDQTAKCLLGEHFKRQLLMDGQYGAVTFICTKTDILVASEIIRPLKLEERISPHDEKISKIEEELDPLKVEEMELEEEITEMKEKLETLEAEKRESEADLGELSVAMTQEMESGECDSEANEHVKSLEEQVKAKDAEINELSEVVAKKKSDLEKISNRVLELKNEISKERMTVSAICANARNEYSRGRIKDDFKAGLREMKRKANRPETAEDDEEDDATEDDADIGSAAGNLEVFCCSSIEYLKMKKKLPKETPAQVFSEIQDTGIPKVQSYIHQMTQIRQKQGTERILLSVAQLVTDINNYLAEEGTEDTTDRGTLKAVVEEQIVRLETNLQQLTNEFEVKVCKAIEQGIRPKLKEGVQIAKAQAMITTGKWGLKFNKQDRQKGGLHYMTYKAVVRRDGVYRSPTAGSIDFNEDLTGPIYTSITFQWDQFFNNNLRRLFDGYQLKILSALRQFGSDLCGNLGRLGLPQGRVQRINQMYQTSAAHKLKEQIRSKEELIRTHQTEASRSMTPVVQTQMTPSYNTCAAEAGPGSYDRMRNHMNTHVQGHKETMFDVASQDLLARLHDMGEMITDGELVKSVIHNLKIQYEPLWDSPENTKALQMAYLPGIKLCHGKAQDLLKDAGLEIKQTVKTSPKKSPVKTQGRSPTLQISASPKRALMTTIHPGPSHSSGLSPARFTAKFSSSKSTVKTSSLGRLPTTPQIGASPQKRKYPPGISPSPKRALLPTNPPGSSHVNGLSPVSGAGMPGVSPSSTSSPNLHNGLPIFALGKAPNKTQQGYSLLHSNIVHGKPGPSSDINRNTVKSGMGSPLGQPYHPHNRPSPHVQANQNPSARTPGGKKELSAKVNKGHNTPKKSKW